MGWMLDENTVDLMFGGDGLPDETRGEIARADFSYVPLDMCDAIRYIADGERPHSGLSSADKRISVWEDTWGLNYHDYLKSGMIDSLLPDYLFKYRTLRLNHQYIRADRSDFEARFYRMAIRLIARRYLGGVDKIVDFGCGSGAAIGYISDIYPTKSYTGCDWTSTSQLILDAMRENTGRDIRGGRFDMLRPKQGLPIDIGGNTAVTTILAMEQLGRDFLPLLSYITLAKPAIIVHLEPIVEFYNENNDMDILAIDYHRGKGYLEGYWPKLRNLEELGLIEILMARRLGFGSLYHEAYSLVVWRLKKGI